MKKTLKSVDLCLINGFILSLLVILIGVLVMAFKTFGLNDIILYISILFYIFAFFSTIMYFVRRKEGDYELLLLSLINIMTATFMFVFKSDNPAMILGVAMTIYTILLVANRGYKILVLRRENNFMWIIKFVTTFLIAFLGALTSINLFNEVTVQTMMFGYYFISLGFILTMENVIEIFITDSKFKKILAKILEDEPKRELEEIKEPEVMVKKKAGRPKKNVANETQKTATKTTSPKTKNKVAANKKTTTANKTAATKKATTTKKTATTKKASTKAPAKKVGRPKKKAE